MRDMLGTGQRSAMGQITLWSANNQYKGMSLEAKLKEKYKSEMDQVDDVEELVLDGLVSSLGEITESDKKYIERFNHLTCLGMNFLGLTSLRNMPSIPTIHRLELNDNKIAGDLSALTAYPELERLEMENNAIADVAQLEALKKCAKLRRLSLAGCPVTQKEGFKDKVFEILGGLQILDGCNKAGQEVLEESDDEEEEYEEEAEEEDEDDGELDAEEVEEFLAAQKRGRGKEGEDEEEEEGEFEGKEEEEDDSEEGNKACV